MNSKQNNLSGGVPTYFTFKGDCGEAKGKKPKKVTCTERKGMKPGSAWKDNGACVVESTDCIVGNDGAEVISIELTKNELAKHPVYKYVIEVNAFAPKGIGTGSFYLAFTDASGDTYYLKVYDEYFFNDNHTVKYNSNKPNIVDIYWCNHSFTIPSSKSTKPDYLVINPGHEKED